MTRKDYELIAATIKNATQGIENRSDDMRYQGNTIAFDLAEAFERDNPRFDRLRFIQACGVGSTC